MRSETKKGIEMDDGDLAGSAMGSFGQGSGRVRVWSGFAGSGRGWESLLVNSRQERASMVLCDGVRAGGLLRDAPQGILLGTSQGNPGDLHRGPPFGTPLEN